MFATLLGRYPASPAAALADQLAAGLGLLADGGPAARLAPARAVAGVPVAAAPSAIVARWRRASDLAGELAIEAGLEPRPVKACLAIGLPDDERQARRFDPALDRLGGLEHRAEAIAAAIEGLAAAGAPVVQLEADGLALVDPDDGRTIESVRALLGQALAEVPDGLHVSLSVAGGSVERSVGQALLDLPIASVAVDLCAGPDNWYLAARVPATHGLIVGVADARSALPDDEAIMVWGARYAASLGGRGAQRVGLSTSTGLERLSRTQAQGKLVALAAAARLAGLDDAEELKRRLDPRAVDARSAALGRYEPGRQRDVVIGPPPPKRHPG